MSRKKIHSFKELHEAYLKLHPEIALQELLLSYGIDIPLNEIKNIQILEKNKNAISYLNTRTNEIITSDLFGRVYQKYDEKYSVGLTISNPDKNFFVEHYHAIRPAKTYKEAAKNALESRNNPDTKLLSRAYADIDTKYGNFCLHIEEGYTNYRYGPSKQVSLYYGNHEQVIDPLSRDFDFHKYCLCRWKHLQYCNFNQWQIGYVNEYFDGPGRNIWNYGISNKNDQETAAPIHASHLRSGREGGVIFIDGDLKIAENEQCVPDIFTFSDDIREQFDEYEILSLTSKAYFCNYRACVAILKTENQLTIEYKKKEIKTGEWSKSLSENIDSMTNKEFTCDDLKKIISRLEGLDINESLKKFIISELISYTNIHKEDELATLGAFSLEPFSFEQMLEYIKQFNLQELVEKGIETILETFHMDIDELLGKCPPNQLEEAKVNKLLKNNIYN